MKTDQRITIVYASDDNYAEIMGISILSLLETNPEAIDIYILEHRISDKNKQRINAVCTSYHRNIPTWIPTINIKERVHSQVSLDRGSISQYSRLFIAESLPHYVNRVLYLDCDILIQKSLQDLWQMDMKGKTVAALSEPFSRLYRANLNLMPDDPMFNSGVMLVDLKRWRKLEIQKQVLDYIISKNGQVQHGDQGALNAVLALDTLYISPKYNALTNFYDLSYDEMMNYRKPVGFYNKAHVEQAANDPVIVHFTTSFLSKHPWERECEHPYCKQWLDYKKRSPWQNEPLRSPRRSKLGKLYIGLMKHLPRKVMLWISGLLQAYGRPIYIKLFYR